MENSTIYKETRDAFDAEALKPNGMFSKELTDCEKLSLNYLENFVSKNTSILEIGAGFGNVIEKLRSMDKHAIDISPEMIKHCEIIKTKVGDMDNLPYPANRFDLVYMICVMQHSKDKQKTLSEMERVTKNRGTMVIIDGDRNSGIGQLREQEIKKGTWQMCGEAEWLDEKDFPEWEVKKNNHILILTKLK